MDAKEGDSDSTRLTEQGREFRDNSRIPKFVIDWDDHIVNKEKEKNNMKPFSYPERRRPRQVKPEPLIKTVGKSSTGSNQHYVFVHGNVAKTHIHGCLFDRATHLGEFRTLERFPCVTNGKHLSASLLDMPQVGNHVKGDLYAVDNALLADLDYLQRIGCSTSSRRIIKVSNCHDRSFVADAYSYFKDAFQKTPHASQLTSECNRHCLSSHDFKSNSIDRFSISPGKRTSINDLHTSRPRAALMSNKV